LPADITVFQMEQGEFELADCFKQTRKPTTRFVPLMAFKDGVRFTPTSTAAKMRRTGSCTSPKTSADRSIERHRDAMHHDWMARANAFEHLDRAAAFDHEIFRNHFETNPPGASSGMLDWALPSSTLL